MHIPFVLCQEVQVVFCLLWIGLPKTQLMWLSNIYSYCSLSGVLFFFLVVEQLGIWRLGAFSTICFQRLGEISRKTSSLGMCACISFVFGPSFVDNPAFSSFCSCYAPFPLVRMEPSTWPCQGVCNVVKAFTPFPLASMSL